MSEPLYKRIKDWIVTITKFRSGDVIPVDGPSGTAKMSKDDLLKETAQNALAGNVAPAFDPTRTSGNAYRIGEAVTYNGKTYIFKLPHYGAWSASDVIEEDVFKNLMKIIPSQIFAGWTRNIDDLNKILENSVIRMSVNSSTTTLNIPSDFRINTSDEGVLFTIKENYSNSDYRIYQTIIRDFDGKMWYRYYQSSNTAWVAWKVTTSDKIPLNENQIFHTSSTNPADLNDLKSTEVIRVWRDSSVTTSNFPSDYPVDAKGTLSIYRVFSTKSSNQWQVYQTLTLDSTNELWVRMYNSITSAWGSWSKAVLPKDVILIGSGQTYSTLRAGLAAAYAKTDAEVVIMPGTYDCVAEWSTEMHAVTESTPIFGNSIGHGTHVVAMPGAKIIAKVERTDFSDLTDAEFGRLRTYFEPIGSKDGSFTVENLYIESKNTRYCFHDDNGGTSVPAVHKFLNCRMIRYTEYGEARHNPLVACIGGGLSKKLTVIIDGGWYKSVPDYGNLDIMSGDVNYAQIPISYHHNSGSGVEASITIKNVYLDDKGFFRFGFYGTTSDKCKVLVSGCRMKYPPLLCRETTGATVENFELVGWCNEVVESGHWTTATSGSLDSDWVAG